MVRRMTGTRSLLLGLLVPAALGFSATQAQAAGDTISLAQNGPAVAGRAANFTAGGTLSPDDTMFGFDIYIFLKNPDVDPTCAADLDGESAAASHSGGNESYVSPYGGFQMGMGGAYNQPFKITFTGGGDYLLCGYVQGDFSTFASAQLLGTVAAAPAVTPPVTTTPPATTPVPAVPAVPATPAAPATPIAVRKPWITRKGDALTCHPGTWSNAPTHLGYRWYATGKAVGSGRRLTVRRSLKGRTVACRVTATNAAGAQTAASRAVRAR